jgi:hypothetical protein
MPTGKQQYFYTGSSKPLAGGKVYTYAAGASTPKVTYQDAAGTIPNTNPVVLDSTGSALIYWSGSYKVVITDAFDVPIYTVDNYNTDPFGVAPFIASLAASGGASLIGFLQAGIGAIPTTVRDELRAFVRPEQFGAIGDGVADDTAAFNAALATGKNVHLTKSAYNVTALNFTMPAQTLYMHGALLKIVQLNINADNVTIDLGGGEIRGPLHVGKLAAQAATGQNQLVFEDASQFVVGDQIWCSYGDNVSNFPLATPTAITAISGNTVTLAANLTGTVAIAAGTYVGTFSWTTLVGSNASKNLRFINGKMTNSQGYFLYTWRWNQADFATNIPNILCEKIDFSGNGLDQFLFVKARAKFVDCTFGTTYDVAKTGFAYGDDADIELVRCRIARGNFDYDFSPVSDSSRNTYFQGLNGRICVVDCYFDGTNKNPAAPYFNANALHSVWFGSGGAPHDGLSGRPALAHFTSFSFVRSRWENYSRSVFSTTVVADPYAILADSVEFDDCQIGTQAFQLKSMVAVTIRNFTFYNTRFFSSGGYAFTQVQNPKFVARMHDCSLKLSGTVPQLACCAVSHSTIYDSSMVSADASTSFDMIRLQNAAIRTDVAFGYTQFTGTFIIDDVRFAGQSANLTDMGLMTLQNGQGAGIRVRSANGSLWYDVAAFSGKAYILPELSLSWSDGRITGLYGDDWNMGQSQNVRQAFGGQYKATYSLPATTSGSSVSGSTSIAVTSVGAVGNRPATGDRVFIQLADGTVHATTIAAGYTDGSLAIPLSAAVPAGVNNGANVWFVRLVAL